jgi:hypothetical protein
MQELRSSAIGWERSGGSWGPVLGTLEGVEPKVEYTALVSVKVNLGTGEVASVDTAAPAEATRVRTIRQRVLTDECG